MATSGNFVVPYIKTKFPEVAIQASVFMHINHVGRIREALKMGITEFCLDVSVNRDRSELERIREFKKIHPEVVVKLLANHGCYRDCGYGQDHENWSVFSAIAKKLPGKSRKYLLGDRIDHRNCYFKAESLADEIRRTFIRPEDISFYEKNGLADHIKIAYRHDRTPVLRRKLQAYFDRSYKGDLFDLAPSNHGLLPVVCMNKAFPSDFVRKVCACDDDCDRCSYCADVARQVLRKKI